MALLDKKYRVSIGGISGFPYGTILEGDDLASICHSEKDVKRLLDLNSMYLVEDEPVNEVEVVDPNVVKLPKHFTTLEEAGISSEPIGGVSPVASATTATPTKDDVTAVVDDVKPPKDDAKPPKASDAITPPRA